MVKISEIIEFLELEIINVFGEYENKYVKYLKPIELVDEFTLDWVSFNNQNKQQIVEQSKAKVIICDTTILYSELLYSQNKILIQVNNPKLTIALITEKFFILKQELGIHPTAIIHPEAIIGRNVYIGPYTCLGKCEIGDRTILLGNIFIDNNVKIGTDVIIQAGLRKSRIYRRY